ncbi:hypothetical protein BDZ94DRAFT_1356091 [Collybia nuda]|uniref:C2H2-type domain-containing protein n=1 Tax=Collybia nuda TaxID=64659 RepID=A0A9P5XQH0_9AGAR|nr:hypothetical protein BDZ94DRAFT_1356091 [Collybia nuda]
MPRRNHKPRIFTCIHGTTPICKKGFTTMSGMARHVSNAHQPAQNHYGPPQCNPSWSPTPHIHNEPPLNNTGMQGAYTRYHPILDGTPCDPDGNDLPFGTAPPNYTPPELTSDNWDPFSTRVEFEVADFLYRRNQMPGTHIDDLLDLWAASLRDGDEPPFANHNDLYSTIDAIRRGGKPWSSFAVQYSGNIPDEEPPPWMVADYEVWYCDPRAVIRNQLANLDFVGEIDVAPLQEFGANGERVWSNFMSRNWSWNQADIISEDPQTHGGVFVPIILGSDKTTVSVATGQNEYYPLYASVGNVHNNVRRGHRNTVSIIGFLSIPKTDRQYADDPTFRKFRRQLFHSSLETILEPFCAGMTVPEITRFPDGHLRRAIFGLGPYIADYPEQVLLGCIVQGWCARCTAHRDNLDGEGGQRSHAHTRLLMESLDHQTLWREYGVVGDVMPFTSSFPRADIHELLAPDLLHQLIKGTFKDHLVTWVGEYLVSTHGEAHAAAIMADIDRRIAAVPAFPGLRRFPQGRGFKQWTGDDSKALMKVYLPAISGHVPQPMVQALRAFLDFCYLVRRNIITEATLGEIDDALARFHLHRQVFEQAGVRLDGISLPRQHSMVHYRELIEMFGAPNGLCSSITESKHIKAVKEPWRRSSHFEALGQMLVTNQRLDKLAAARVDFMARGMLNGSCLAPHLNLVAPIPPPPAPVILLDTDDEAVNGPRVEAAVSLAKTRARKYPSSAHDLGKHIDQPQFLDHIRRFLYDQLNPDSALSGADLDINDCPPFEGRISVFHSAVATYYAPSDHSGNGGMHRQRIRSVPRWRKGPARRNCAFLEKDPLQEGVLGLHVVQVLLFFSFIYRQVVYPCALVEWFIHPEDCTGPCEDTGMWIVEPEYDENGCRATAVVHIDCMVRGAHLIPVYGDQFLPRAFNYTDSLTSFHSYYISKYADHHMNEIAF